MSKLQLLPKLTQIPQFELDPTCVFYAPLYELDGDNRYNRTVLGATWGVTGTSWGFQGRTFSGVDQYINCGKPSFLSNQAGTILTWAKPTNTDEAHFLSYSKYSTGAVDEFKAELRLNEFRLEVHNNSVYTHKLESTGTDFPVNTWHLIGLTSDGSTTLLYKNGVTVALTESTGAADGVWFGDLVTDADQLTIGALARSSGYSADFIGIIGEVLIYNRALSALEQLHIYDITKWRYV